ncbi:MAG: hypothetical protein ABI678_18045 [Kofleriaceae bacterium]
MATIERVQSPQPGTITYLIHKAGDLPPPPPPRKVAPPEPPVEKPAPRPEAQAPKLVERPVDHIAAEHPVATPHAMSAAYAAPAPEPKVDTVA